MADPNVDPVADPAAAEAIRDELEPGGRVLWAAHTQRAPEPEGCLGMGVPVALGGYAVAAFCFWIIVDGRFRQAEVLAVVLFVLATTVAIFVTFGTIFATIATAGARRRPRDVLNVLTDRRVIVRQPDALYEAHPVTVSVRPGEFAVIERTDRSEGRGNLVFQVPSNRGVHSVRFENVPDVRGVEGLVRRALLSDKVVHERATPSAPAPPGDSTEVPER